MAIEVRELVIKAFIDETSEKKPTETKLETTNREEIITDCVEQVMQLLRDQSER